MCFSVFIYVFFNLNNTTLRELFENLKTCMFYVMLSGEIK